MLEGEAGIGKTALLTDLEASTDGFRTLRACGVQAESQVAYAGLLSLCRPLLGSLGVIPAGHADAVRAALGLVGGAATTQRLLVGAGFLDLLAAESLAKPLLVLVDDLHWLDGPSAQAVLFALRRLDAEPVAVVVAVRTAAALPARLDGVSHLVLTGLDTAAARAMVGRLAPGTAPEVADRLQQATGGNPLALAEIAASLSDAQRSGREILTDPLPGPKDLQAWYAGRVASFADQTQRALLVAAAAGDTTITLLAPALARLDCEMDDLAPAAESGLVTIERAGVRWRHPLVRSGVYYGAPVPDRRGAHLAIAAGLAPQDPAWAWHQLAAAKGPDESVARALDRVSSDARTRAGFSTAAAASEQAARISPSPPDAQRRLYHAADAAWLGGDPARAIRLLNEALAGSSADQVLHGQMLFLRGYTEYATGDLLNAADLLHRAAGLLWSAEPEAAAQALGEAVLASWWAGEASQMRTDAELLESLAAAHPRVATYARFAAGTALMFAGHSGQGTAFIEQALADHHDARAESADPRDIWVVAGLGWLGRTAEGRSEAEARLLAFRRSGVLGMLPRLLRMLSSQDLDDDRWDDAAAEATEGLEWCGELSQAGHRSELLAVLATVAAWRGEPNECSRCASLAVTEAEAHGNYWTPLVARRALALSHLGHRRYELAAAAFEPIVDVPLARGLRGPTLASFPDLIEALVRLGRHEDAAMRTAQFEERLTGIADPRAGPLLLRCRALIDSPSDAGACYEAALAGHGAEPDAFVVSRTRLVYGEWLRRRGRRREARAQLSAALDDFASYRAIPWAERARDELRASGATLAPRPVATGRLTPGERRVATLAAQGLPTKELCAQLYLSHKTVETHLGRVYRKLGVRNRTELARRMRTDD